jgi:hypothetical protein
MSGGKIQQNLVYNPDFNLRPSGGVATTTTDRWVDGTASSGSSYTDRKYGWGFSYITGVNGSSATGSAIFDNKGGYNCITLDLTGASRLGSSGDRSDIHNIKNYQGPTLDSRNKLFLIPVKPNTKYTISGDYYINSCSDTVNIATTINAQRYDITGIIRKSSTSGGNKFGTTLNTWLTSTGSFTTASDEYFVVITLAIALIAGDGDNREMNSSFKNIRLTEVSPQKSKSFKSH